MQELFFHRSGQEAMQRCPRMAYFEYAYMGIGIHLSPRAIWFDVGIAVHYGIGEMLSGRSPQEAIDYALLWFQEDSGQTEEKLGFRFWEQQTLIEALLWSFAYYALPSLQQNYEFLFIERQVIRKRSEWVGNGTLQIVNVSRPDLIARDKVTGEIAVFNWKTINDVTTERREHQLRGMQGFREHYFTEFLLERLSSEISQELHELGDLIKADPQGMEKLESSFDSVRKLMGIASKLPRKPIVDFTQFVYLVKGRRVREKGLAEVHAKAQPSENGSGLGKLEGVTDRAEYFDFSTSDSLNTKAAQMVEEADWTTSDWRQDSFLIYPWFKQQKPSSASPSPSPSPSTKKGKGAKGKGSGKGQEKEEYEPEYSWQYRYKKPDHISFNALGSSYQRELVSLSLTTQNWIKSLHDRLVFPSTLDPSLPNPLSKIVVFENPLYRDERMMESLDRQLRQQELVYARKFNYIEHVRGKGGFDKEMFVRELDRNFPQHLHNCLSPTRCQFHSFCHGKRVNEVDFNSIPAGYELRVPHHFAEKQYVDNLLSSREGEERDHEREEPEPENVRNGEEKVENVKVIRSHDFTGELSSRVSSSGDKGPPQKAQKEQPDALQEEWEDALLLQTLEQVQEPRRASEREEMEVGLEVETGNEQEKETEKE